MDAFLRPSIVKVEAGEDQRHATAVIEPCYWGYGTTLGNALRRVMLSSLPGAGVVAVKLKGVSHEFSSMEGVKEDVVEILLNIKRLNLKLHVPEARLTLEHTGAGEVTASAIAPNADVEIANPELVIATVTDAKTEFSMEIFVEQGRGYMPVEERETKELELGTIAVDAIFNPIVSIGYRTENMRVGDVTNYERLLIDIETDGTVEPEDALRQASEILVEHFTIVREGGSGESTEIEPEVPSDEPEA